MSDISGDIPEGTNADETAVKDKAVQPEEVLSDELQPAELLTEAVQPAELQPEELQTAAVLTADAETSEDLPEFPSRLVVRRVRTSPVEVLPRTPKDRGLLYSLLDTARFISLGLVIGILLVVFVVQRNDVYGPSMEPNLHEEDAVFVEMISKYFSAPERGDIMTVNATGLPGYSKPEKIIKRVIGLPGETVTIKDGYVYINGVLLDEPYLADSVPTYINDSGVASGYDNVTLGENEYYFLGDNRGASLDSRVLGPIPTSRIKAHVIMKIYPFDNIGLL